MKPKQKQLARVREIVPASWWKTVGGLITFGILCPVLYWSDTPSERNLPAPSGNLSRQTIHPVAHGHKPSSSTKQVEAALSSGNASDKDYAMRHSLPQLISQDISAAAKMAENLKPWAWREEVSFEVAREWARQDPIAASAWARQLGDSTERANVLGQVCIEIAKTDPIRALGMTENNRPLQEQILQILAMRDSDEAIRWAEKLTDSDTRQAAFARVALGHAETSPQEAARMVAEHMTSSSLQDETALAVLHKWILRDPGGAQAWVEIFPDGPLLEIAESELAAAAAYPAAP